MKRNQHIKCIITLLIISSFSCRDQRSNTKKLNETATNVIVIITDDQGWGDIGYNNQAAYTPNLDQLAEQGALFTNHYSMPQCTPTRVALFTGRYPGRFGTNALQANNKPVFPKGITTLASMFQEVGYKTFLCGKWHMGSDAENGPNNYGFDESYGSLAGAVGMYDHRYREGKYEIAWHSNHKVIPGHENGVHATDLVTEKAIKYIKQKHEKPYFMYLAFHAPHTPLDERGEFVDIPTQPDPQDSTRWMNEDNIRWFNDPEGKIQSEPDPEKRLLLAAVHHVDHAIGKVVQTLEETGQLDHTLILFTSDNGPQVNWNGDAYPNDLHLTDFNQPIPMRGSKLDVYEGGIHVPGFAYWKGHISPKKVSEQVHVVDWFPTLAKLIDYPAQTNLELDGTDLWPILVDNEKLEQRDLYWIWNSNTNRWALRHGKWKIVKYGEKEPNSSEEWQLFNLHQDPKEETDVAKEYPKKRTELHQMFITQRAKDEVDSPF